MNNQVTTTTLSIEYFRGFTMSHANEVTVQLGDGGDHISIILNNCVKHSTSESPTMFANFSAYICNFIREERVTEFTISYWDIPQTAPTTHLLTRREADEAALRASLIDRDMKGTKKYYGYVELKYGRGTLDIRSVGLERGVLCLIERAKWINDSSTACKKLTKAAKRGSNSPKLIVYKDIRAIVPNMQNSVRRYRATISVSSNVMGAVIGHKGQSVCAVQDEFAVRITTTESGFTVEGEQEQDVGSAVTALEGYVPGEVGTLGRDGKPIKFSASPIRDQTVTMRYEDVFLNMAGKLCKAMIIGSKSIVCYTLLMDVILNEYRGEVTTVPSIVEVELIGLQAVFTRGNNKSWLNRCATDEFLNAAQRYSARLVGQHVDISFEAMGYAQGSARRNIHALIFHNKRLLNADILRLGYCKLMQSARYYNPETCRRDDPIRSLFPCMRNLLSVSKSDECNGLSWCGTECMMLDAEREAARNGLGIWKTTEPTDPLIGQRPSPVSKRHVFIDNSNIWISGKHFSGQRQGLGFDRARRKSEKFKDNNRKWSEIDLIISVAKSNSVRQFVCDRRPYCASDRGWRLDIHRLLWLVGYDKKVDPKFHVAGSVPPLNEDIWNHMRKSGSINILTGRTNEGQSSSEDTSLVDQIYKSCDHISECDEFVLCAGDRGYRNTIKTVRERFPSINIYVVSWAHNAYHRLKDMQDDGIFFINLDPYIDYLRYSSEAIADVTCTPTVAGDERRLVTTCETNREAIFQYLKSTHKLLVDRDFSMSKPNSQGVLRVIFTKEQRDLGVVNDCTELFPMPTGGIANRKNRTLTLSNGFDVLAGDSDDEDVGDEEDDLVYDDDFDDVDVE
eukprot:CAMPEP_0185021184 /NCGR_PEP_ID=MMETSP1103-20130426/3863_1 /TAXON_ID=36769 /ORGANISM="Paraphysomonas bandaiensis, Strain Caron Lab Isolate" /LENGTH=847 /DNA_ID=CAMNT_0027552555 /DNA_START=43 /DNA_END=2586 /DNA_ORIENTATION=-